MIQRCVVGVTVLVRLIKFPTVNGHIPFFVLVTLDELRESVCLDVHAEDRLRIDDFGFYFKAVGKVLS